MSDTAPQTSALDGWMDICRTGTWTDMHDRRVTIDTGHLDGFVQSFANSDPVPVVVGHPEHDAPAYAHVSGLRRVGDRLQMTVKNVMPAFREAVEAGRYTGRSIATKEGSLRHVGFLGGRAPAIPGLAPTAFSDTPDQVVEIPDTAFASDFNPLKWLLKSVARTMRGMREYLIEKEDTEAADKFIPAWQIDNISEAADDLADRFPGSTDAQMGAPADPENEPSGDPMSGENQPSQAEMAEREENVKQREAKVAADEKRMKREAAVLAANTALDVHVQAGRVLPAERAGLAALLASLPDGEGDTVLCFAEPAATDGAQPQEVQKKPRDVFEAFLASLPKRVELGEVAGADTAPPTPTGAPAPTGFHAPAGREVDPESLDLHRKATALAAEQSVTYVQAVDMIQTGVANG